MAPEDLERKLRSRPFTPFRMYLSDGATYEVNHPELVLLGRRSLVLGLTADPQATLYERAIDVDLLHTSPYGKCRAAFYTGKRWIGLSPRESGPLRGWHLLGQAMECAQAPDNVGAIETDDLPSWE